MNSQEEFNEALNSLLDLINDIDLNITLKEVLGVAPVEIASLIVKENGENIKI